MGLPLQREAAFAFEQITVSTVSVRLTLSNVLAVPHPARIELFLEGAPIRYRMDGTAPDTSTGPVMTPYSTLVLKNGNDMFNFRAIRDGTTDGTLNVHYFR